MTARLLRTTGILVIACAWLVQGFTTRAEDRTAAAILKDYDAVELPKFDEAMKADKAAIRAYRDAYGKAQGRRAAYALELLNADPDNTRLPKVILQRWVDLMMNPATGDQAVAEIDRAIPHFKDKAEIREADFIRTIVRVRGEIKRPEKALAIADEFIGRDPKDERGALLLNGMASEAEDPALKAKFLERLLAAFPDSLAAKSARKSMELLGRVGKPLDLEFVDAIRGTTVSIKGLKGKVVVLDFWATWCGPCVAEMPKMKALYAKYHDQGVEFIGVSLDSPKEEGGLDKLKEFVAKNEIPWPQYYQGDGWESDFSSGLGISSIPQLFLVAADGTLASVDARGKLDELIPAQLAKVKGAAAPE